MELEFDKEIDAILRRSRGGGVVSTATGGHLDADTVAAFVDNALPDSSRRIYMSHLADCDRCRKILSQTVLTSDRTAPAMVGAEVVEGAAATVVPWYVKLFKSPGLAVAMGALVITFSGVLGYLMLRDRGAAENATISQSVNKELPRGGGPYDVSDGALAPLASSANVTNANAMPAPSSAISMPLANTAANTSATPAAKNEETAATIKPEAFGLSKSDKDLSATGGVAAEPPKTAADAAPPPAPVMKSADAVTGTLDRDEKKAEVMSKLGAEREDSRKQKELAEDLRGRRAEQPPPASKSGPARMGPLQNQSNIINQSQMGEMSVTRSVAGKTFENRQGAWYDREYHGGATSNYKRGTAEYLKLDRGLRSIADNVGGTVVVVWKGKAYRIS